MGHSVRADLVHYSLRPSEEKLEPTDPPNIPPVDIYVSIACCVAVARRVSSDNMEKFRQWLYGLVDGCLQPLQPEEKESK